MRSSPLLANCSCALRQENGFDHDLRFFDAGGFWPEICLRMFIAGLAAASAAPD